MLYLCLLAGMSPSASHRLRRYSSTSYMPDNNRGFLIHPYLWMSLFCSFQVTSIFMLIIGHIIFYYFSLRTIWLKTELNVGVFWICSSPTTWCFQPFWASPVPVYTVELGPRSTCSELCEGILQAPGKACPILWQSWLVSLGERVLLLNQKSKCHRAWEWFKIK